MLDDLQTASGFSLDLPPAPWPDWLEDRRMDDDIVGAAYEAVPAQLRASIKTGLALAFAHFGQREDQTDAVVQKPHAGFWLARRERPAPWCAIVMDASYAAAARLTAACALPRLCDVPEVFALLVSDSPDAAAHVGENVLAALTLSGVEDVFVLTQAEATQLLQDMAGDKAPAGPAGRVVLLHDGGPDGALARLGRTARDLHLPVYEEHTPPAITVLPDSPCSAALLAFAHGNITPSRTLEAHTQALAAPAPTAPQACAQRPEVEEALRRGLLVLMPDCEGFWLHPGLGPDFFMTRGLAAGML